MADAPEKAKESPTDEKATPVSRWVWFQNVCKGIAAFGAAATVLIGGGVWIVNLLAPAPFIAVCQEVPFRLPEELKDNVKVLKENCSEQKLMPILENSKACSEPKQVAILMEATFARELITTLDASLAKSYSYCTSATVKNTDDSKPRRNIELRVPQMGYYELYVDGKTAGKGAFDRMAKIGDLLPRTELSLKLWTGGETYNQINITSPDGTAAVAWRELTTGPISAWFVRHDVLVATVLFNILLLFMMTKGSGWIANWVTKGEKERVRALEAKLKAGSAMERDASEKLTELGKAVKRQNEVARKLRHAWDKAEWVKEPSEEEPPTDPGKKT
jgi:hypothetical protein